MLSRTRIGCTALARYGDTWPMQHAHLERELVLTADVPSLALRR